MEQKDKFDQLEDTALQRQQELKELQGKLWSTVLTCIGIMMVLPWLAKIKIFGIPVFAIAATVYAGIQILSLIKAAANFASTWGGSGFSTTAGIVGGLLAAGVAASWIWMKSWRIFQRTILNLLGMIA